VAEFLADKSAVTRRDTRPEVREVLEPLLLAGRIATCAIVDLELLYSARSPAGYVALSLALTGMPRVAINESIMDRALEVQAELASTSQHRSVSLPDLIVAACAEHHQLALLHYDSDFDRIAAITRQQTRWVVPRGSVS
jgi:predicted nucleic acid-binding protein